MNCLTVQPLTRRKALQKSASVPFQAIRLQISRVVIHCHAPSFFQALNCLESVIDGWGNQFFGNCPLERLLDFLDATIHFTTTQSGIDESLADDFQGERSELCS